MLRNATRPPRTVEFTIGRLVRVIGWLRARQGSTTVDAQTITQLRQALVEVNKFCAKIQKQLGTREVADEQEQLLGGTAGRVRRCMLRQHGGERAPRAQRTAFQCVGEAPQEPTTRQANEALLCGKDVAAMAEEPPAALAAAEHAVALVDELRRRLRSRRADGRGVEPVTLVPLVSTLLGVLVYGNPVALKDGQLVVIMPAGGVSADGVMQRAREWLTLAQTTRFRVEAAMADSRVNLRTYGGGAAGVRS